VLKIASDHEGNPAAEELLLHQLGDIESIAMRDKEIVQVSFLKNVPFEDGGYSISLLLKEQHELLQDNYDLSLVRLNALVKRET
jgi:galactokinase